MRARLLSTRHGRRPTVIRERDRRLCWQAASLLLAYPDEALVADLPMVREAVGALPTALGEPLRALADDLWQAAAQGRLIDAQARYVETFDQKRRRTLFLTYWTAGDTRNRGQAILRFNSAYREAGAAPPTHELADHLAVVLEFAATVDPVGGGELLAAHATPIALVRDSLAEHGSPYAGVLGAVAATLPEPGPGDLREARRLAMAGPPAEAVGLDLAPYPPAGQALLPLLDGAAR